jgi:thiol-disulfide isomerase/thioredoxin
MTFLKRWIPGFLVLLFLHGPLTGQGHRITVCVKGLPDSVVILSHRFGMKFFTDDTVRTDHKGCAVIQGEVPLAQGMYQVVLPDKKYVEFFIPENQVFSIKTTAFNPSEDVSFTNSRGNTVFTAWQHGMNRNRKEISALQGKLKQGVEVADSARKYVDRIKEVQLTVSESWDKVVKDLDGTLAGAFVNGLKPLKYPENLQSPRSENEMLKRYQFTSDHFFDGVNFSDERLLRTPLFESKLDQYFSQVIAPVPDTLVKAADRVIAMARLKPEVYQYVVQFLLNLYTEPKIMGFDAVYVYLAENYYLNGRAPWIDPSNLQGIRARVAEIKPLLLGNPAPPLEGLVDPEGQTVTLEGIGKPILILYFWEPDCGFCKEATPQLVALYPSLKENGIEILAINTRTDKESWKQYIEAQKPGWINAYSPGKVQSILKNYNAWNTPKIVILDKDRKIIAKDITIDNVQPFLEQYLRMNKK